MRVRDAVEDDGEVLGELADAPAEVMRNVVHDRTVRVAEADREETSDADEAGESDRSVEGETGDEPAESAGTAGDDRTGENGGPDDGDDAGTGNADGRPDVVGFVGFDAMPGTVRVTYLRGTRAARERLLEEPMRFARKEGMTVEALVPEGETATEEVVEAAGFQRVGTGPRFEGGRTYKYRLDPSGNPSSARR